MEGRVPNQPEELTASWLTSALVHERAGDDEVVGLQLVPMGEGVGLMGVVCRVALEWAKGTGPATVIAKFPTAVAANLAVAEHFGIYRREVLFYQVVAPLTTIAVPKLLHANLEGPTRFVMLLEDLGAYHPGDQIAGCTPEQAAECVDELVKLHASLWDRVDDPRFEFAFLHSPSLHATGMAEAAINGWDPMVATFGDVVPAFMNEAKERFCTAIPAMQEWMAAPPITFVHGDFRLDNLLFANEPAARSVVTLDWQGVLRSKGVQDVAYLLSQSMTPDDRHANERALVDRWQQGLDAAGVVGYDAEQAWLDYRKAVLYLWVYVSVIAGSLDAGNERGRAFMSCMIDRAASAIEQLDALSLLESFEG